MTEIVQFRDHVPCEIESCALARWNTIGYHRQRIMNIVNNGTC